MTLRPQELAERFFQRQAGIRTPLLGGNFQSSSWVDGMRAGKFARDRGFLPDPPEDRPNDFYEGYTWGYDHAPKIREVE